MSAGGGKSICSRRGCSRPVFFDSERCFDHQSPRWLKAWFFFVAIGSLVMIALVIWGGIALVGWVTSQ